ncbi:uncharacterized protein LOC122391159 [Amphibalanus amphitrite]|uniref:uncharacterized protein LOC122391159 n=1 Tax=Amphibalanus amphitrite TaxID=1232801 RepID=UPI001C9169BC|nr:uncharacterized protein LOC122391159 [Amphibalanus amphitrite]
MFDRRLHLSSLWQWSVLLPLVFLQQGAREFRRLARWVETELSQPVSDSHLGHLVGVYNELCCLSGLLCSSLAPSIFTSLMMLTSSITVMVYQSLVYYLPRCAADPRGDSLCCAVSALATVCIASGLMWRTFSVCHWATEAADQARRRLKHAAAAPRRPLPRPVLDKLHLTASGYFVLDRGMFFHHSYSIFTMCVILIQFAQDEK